MNNKSDHARCVFICAKVRKRRKYVKIVSLGILSNRRVVAIGTAPSETNLANVPQQQDLAYFLTAIQRNSRHGLLHDLVTADEIWMGDCIFCSNALLQPYLSVSHHVSIIQKMFEKGYLDFSLPPYETASYTLLPGTPTHHNKASFSS